MAARSEAPVTRQVSGHAAPAPVPSGPESWQPLAAAVAELPVLDASGRPVPFGELFRERRAIVVFVRVSTGAGTSPAGRDGGCFSRASPGGSYIGPQEWSRTGERSPPGLALPLVVVR